MQLVDAAITSASEITMPHAAGMAFFEAETGRLLSNPAMNMSEETGSVNIFNLNASSVNAEEVQVAGALRANAFVLTSEPLTKALVEAHAAAAAAAADAVFVTEEGDGASTVEKDKEEEEEAPSPVPPFASVNDKGEMRAVAVELLTDHIMVAEGVMAAKERNSTI